jgi:hypothetical protein
MQGAVGPAKSRHYIGLFKFLVLLIVGHLFTMASNAEVPKPFCLRIPHALLKYKDVAKLYPLVVALIQATPANSRVSK